MNNAHRIRTGLLRTCLIAAIAGVVNASVPATGSPSRARVRASTGVARIALHYVANGGRRRIANLVLPAWYGPGANPPIPLVIAPHGSGPGPFLELGRAWGGLPARGGFAVVFPEGQGRVLAHYSWGYRGQIEDLARMPAILRGQVPWLRIDPSRIYAIGGSMGGQESLLLAARYPRLLAGAVSFDAPTDIALRYPQFERLVDGDFMRSLMRTEIGGTPDERPDAYADRSPLHFAAALAASGVPLQIWWSTRDELVVDQRLHSGRLYDEIKRLNPRAPVLQIVGTWAHTAEMRCDRRLPDALRTLGLLPT